MATRAYILIKVKAGKTKDVVGALKRNYGSEVIAEFVDQLAVDEATVSEFERLLARRRSELKS